MLPRFPADQLLVILFGSQSLERLFLHFMFERIICVLVRIKVRGHLVFITQFMNLISAHIWTFLSLMFRNAPNPEFGYLI